MKKWWSIVAAVVLMAAFASAFTGCKPSGEQDFSVTYANGSVTFHLPNGKYDVLRSSIKHGTFSLVATAEGTFTTTDIRSYFIFKDKSGEAIAQPYSYLYSTLGDNVNVFSPSDDPYAIQETINTIHERMFWDQFGLDRHALLFLPGDYEDVTVHVGYYTSVAGLGVSPSEVRVGGFEIPERRPITSSMLTNFWRTVENFTVLDTATFCVSQATSMRRMHIQGDLLLTTGGYGSGGFISDSLIDGTIYANRGSTDYQQQWFTRNTSFGAFSGGQMNMVFVGTNGTLPSLNPNARVTSVDQTGFVREKPFVVFDQQIGYAVYVPDGRYEADGNTWSDTDGSGQLIGIDRFYVARAAVDTAATINAALSAGKHLLFSPGIYKLDAPIEVQNAETIVTGLGLATLAVTERNEDTAIRIADEDGINVSSFLIEAGVNTQSLMEVGSEKTDVSHEANPICLADIFFRSGGSYRHAVSVDKTFVVHSADVFGDNFWMWRADHSFTGNRYEDTMRFYKNESGEWVMDGLKTSDGRDNWVWDGGYVGWSQSKGRVGVEINGDRVTMYGLMVEHYMEYQTIWNGEDGLMCFYQSETPYDAPNQDAWRRNGDSGALNEGWASYKVGGHVQNHTALGVGVYFVSNTPNALKILNHAIEAPASPGITIRNMVIARFAGSAMEGSGIRYIISNSDTNQCYGQSVYSSGAKTYLSSYIGGVVTN